MSTHIYRNGNKRVIVHDGKTYVDRLRSVKHMYAKYKKRMEYHLRAELKSDIMYDWRMALSENAKRRMEQWT